VKQRFVKRRLVVAAFALALVAACKSAREGWGGRGSYFFLHESSSLQVRRGPQRIDPASGELVLAWVGARTLAGEPELVACELTVYDDRDGDEAPSQAEILDRRESLEPARKVLFGDVRTRARSARAQLVAQTSRERCEVGWKLDAD